MYGANLEKVGQGWNTFPVVFTALTQLAFLFWNIQRQAPGTATQGPNEDFFMLLLKAYKFVYTRTVRMWTLGLNDHSIKFQGRSIFGRLVQGSPASTNERPYPKKLGTSETVTFESFDKGRANETHWKAIQTHPNDPTHWLYILYSLKICKVQLTNISHLARQWAHHLQCTKRVDEDFQQQIPWQTE